MGGMQTMGGVPSAGGVPTVGGVPGMTGVAGITGVPAGMTAVPGMTGVARVPNGMSSIYASGEKSPAGLYQPGTAYQGLVQPTYLQQGQMTPSQASYYAAAAAAGQGGYLTASSPTQQTRYMMSPAYSAAGQMSPQGYALSAGGYTYQGQPVTLAQAMPVATSSMSSQTQQSQYPTYLASQMGMVQVSPSQSPYAAAAATGHPLYPSSPYAGLQLQQYQQAQVQAGQMQQRQAYNPSTGLPLGYPTVSSMDAVRASFYPPY